MEILLILIWFFIGGAIGYLVYLVGQNTKPTSVSLPAIPIPGSEPPTQAHPEVEIAPVPEFDLPDPNHDRVKLVEVWHNGQTFLQVHVDGKAVGPFNWTNFKDAEIYRLGWLKKLGGK